MSLKSRLSGLTVQFCLNSSDRLLVENISWGIRENGFNVTLQSEMDLEMNLSIFHPSTPELLRKRKEDRT